MPQAAVLSLNSPTPRELAEEFLKVSSEFQLGHLTTEKNNPITARLSQTLAENVTLGLRLLKEADIQAVKTLLDKAPEIAGLAKAIKETVDAGKRIYIDGCGSTGRLAIIVETLARQAGYTNVFGFMTGGDAALIRSIENAEDLEFLGEQQLEQSGFQDGDLLIAVTEGGETPWVLSTVQHASRISSRKPFCLYCNPDEDLMSVPRSARMLANNNIEKINLTCGPMAIMGSTRMQATTVQISAVTLALNAAWMDDFDEKSLATDLQDLYRMVLNLDYEALGKFTQIEANLYARNPPQGIIIRTDHDLAVSVLGNTTELAPTFARAPFERVGSESHQSLSYLVVNGANNAAEAWRQMLWREPRALEHPDLPTASYSMLSQFDISERTLTRRSNQPIFDIRNESHGVKFSFAGYDEFFAVGKTSTFNRNLDYFFQHLALKLLLNAHSTAVAGLNGRYDGNVMTWVVATNNKLIDRAIRFIDTILLADPNCDFNKRFAEPKRRYCEICYALFEARAECKPDQAVVLKTVSALKALK